MVYVSAGRWVNMGWCCGGIGFYSLVGRTAFERVLMRRIRAYIQTLFRIYLNE